MTCGVCKTRPAETFVPVRPGVDVWQCRPCEVHHRAALELLRRYRAGEFAPKPPPAEAPATAPPALRLPGTPDEALVLSLLSTEPLHVDAIAGRCILTTAMILTALTLLEMKGQARRAGGGCYVRVEAGPARRQTDPKGAS